MNVLTINQSNQKSEWSKLHHLSEKKNQFTLSKVNDSSSFVPEFPSPADDLKKPGSKVDAQKSAKRSRPFTYTSENWIG
jgi:hypothetical protein